MSEKINSLFRKYNDGLLKDVIPFWMKHSIDEEFGGYFTCLDRDGTVYDTDKFMWLQHRQVWMFSKLCNVIEKRTEWLDVAKHGAEFLRDHGMDSEGAWYFSLDRKGAPLTQPHSIFSDCFAAMGYAQYSAASGEEWSRDLALKIYQNILKRQDRPKGKYTKAYPGSRELKSFAIPMILSNLALELEDILGQDRAMEDAVNCANLVMNTFVDKELGIVFEQVAPDGLHVDCFEGRLINPGHGIEAMWFIMSICERSGNREMIDRAVEIVLNTLEFGWDREYQGIYYFMDAKGYPPQQLEWNQKLWWVHVETLISLLKGYRLTGNPKCWSWFEKIHDYAWGKFADPEYGEWFGYLMRDGSKLNSLKGGKWKGCFHVPRGLMVCADELRKLGQMSN